MALNLAFPQTDIPEKANEKFATELLTENSTTDVHLWEEFKAGNEIAFAKIYRLHASLLYVYGMKLVKDKELIKDCIQDLFVEIWNTKNKLGSVKNIKSYLLKSIRRKLISEAIKSRKTVDVSPYLTNLKTISIPLEEWELIGETNSNGNWHRLQEALDRLTAKQREIIHLKFFARLTYSEISETMHISMKGTYKLMGRSIGFLRKNLSHSTL